jgi:preprotein translocase subunit SecD
VPLKIIQESDVDALLGAESLKRSLMAGVVGLGLVMIYIVAYYRMAGVVAAVSLVVYSLIVLALFKMIPITLTLSHIGGFILSIGMAVDANVLIFERMKEEVRIGRTLASSMEVGFNRAWPAIRDGNVSTIITCIVLIWFGDRLGGGLITGFAISLMIGVMASMFTAVVVSRNLLQLLAWTGVGRWIHLFTPEGIHRAGDATVGGS